MKNQNQFHDESMWKGAPANNFLLAKQLRERMTQAELLMWDKLKNKQYKGYKFRRQHPLHKFIVDFYCHELKLIIEIDGKYHDLEEQKNKDLNRTELLRFQGFDVCRISSLWIL